ncbi:UNVERIFIED_CONTAM: hypothetical protein Scaly_3061500 [Sesamum calycinum]|uniref:Uncharacterized protein n=1 Tax=Sesamum calycinum TaxID=2727403 RepID=A0AAW2K133_9LAMI
MYEKNLSSRAGLTPEFEDGVATFIDGPSLNMHIWMVRKLSVLVRSIKMKISKSWTRCTRSKLVYVAKLVNIKTEGHFSQHIYDRITQWADHISPRDHNLSIDYYITKKLMRDLSLSFEKIDACKNGCMFYWKNDIDLDYYKFCAKLGTSLPGREILIAKKPRVTFLADPHNDRLGLCTNGFTQHGSMIIHIHVCPLYLHCTISHKECASHRCLPRAIDRGVAEFVACGVQTYNYARNDTFTMCAALMWTVNNLPTYGMASGWSFNGVIGCPVCMEDARAFYQQNRRKACYFDYHRQFLPPDHPYRRNKKTYP